jgi:uncharacterized protein (DUF58 family)
MAEGGEALDAVVAAVVARYRLRLHGRRFRGGAGARRSPAAGGGVELVDHRDYTPGDDVRHVDWRGFARSDQLRVRQFELDSAPRVDLLVDTSASMAVTAAKAAALRALVLALVGIARGEAAAVRVLPLGGDAAVDAAALAIGDGPASPAPPSVPLRAGGVRILLTDALWPAGPQPLLRTLQAQAGHFVCVQLLDPWEAAPRAGDAVTLVDVETGARAERTLDRAAVVDYGRRLARLGDELRAAVVGAGGVLAQVVAGELAAMCADALLPALVLEPA